MSKITILASVVGCAVAVAGVLFLANVDFPFKGVLSGLSVAGVIFVVPNWAEDVKRSAQTQNEGTPA